MRNEDTIQHLDVSEASVPSWLGGQGSNQKSVEEMLVETFRKMRDDLMS